MFGRLPKNSLIQYPSGLIAAGAVLLGVLLLIMHLFAGLGSARASMSSRHGKR